MWVLCRGAYLVLAPGPVDAIAYRPLPAPPLSGVLAPNDKLKGAELIGIGQIIGPEDVAVDEQGRIYGGTLDESGQIVRSLHDIDGEHLRTVTSVEARNGFIFCGSLCNDLIGRLRVKGVL